MSTVYLAERTGADFSQQVALKLIKRGLDTDDLLRRFRTERQVLAGLEHPNIARLIDGGAAEDGRPYLVMEHVEGVAIDRYCDRQSLPISERLRLFRAVCAAVHYAHRNLVIHRDLKPSNILVNADGEAKLLDFGIAKVLRAEGAGPTVGATLTAQRAMTPRYASPEQIRGERVTTATDVYSLGVVLYEMMTGHPPYQIGSGTPAEIERVVCTEEPTRPSTIIRQTSVSTTGAALTPRSVSATREGEPGRLSRRLSGDLDNIVLMALRKEPERRYASVEQLSEDIRRHLDGLPVIARPDTIRYRSAKFVRRNAVAVGAGAAVVLALVAASVISTVQSIRANRARVEAETQRASAEQISGFLQEMLSAIDPVQTQSRDEVSVREVLDVAAQRIDAELSERPAVAAALHTTIGTTYRNLTRYEEAEKSHRRALQLRRALYGELHPDVVESSIRLGLVLQDRNQLEESERVLRDAVAISDRVHDGPRPQAAECRRQLASVLRARGEREEAESVVREAIAIRRGAGDTKGLVGDLNDLGLVLRDRGNYQEAEAVFREALSAARDEYGENHTFVAQLLNNLGWTLQTAGRNDEAIPIFRQAVTVNGAVFPAHHPNVVSARGNLAGSLRETGRNLEAIAVYQEVLDTCRTYLGADHPAVAYTLNNIALVYEAEENWDAALEYLREALRNLSASRGKEHPEVVAIRFNLARVLHRAGHTSEAERECLATLQARRRILRPAHPDIARSADLMGEILMDRGDYAGAEPLLREAVEIGREALPVVSARRAAGEVRLGRCLASLRRFAEAETLLLAGHAVLDSTRGAEDARSRSAAEALALLYDAWGLPEKAAEYRVRTAR